VSRVPALRDPAARRLLHHDELAHGAADHLLLGVAQEPQLDGIHAAQQPRRIDLVSAYALRRVVEDGLELVPCGSGKPIVVCGHAGDRLVPLERHETPRNAASIAAGVPPDASRSPLSTQSNGRPT
jgi:hypothetical protein